VIAIVRAAPGALLDPLIATCRDVAATEVWSPLAAPAWLARAPGALGRFARRRARQHDEGTAHLALAERSAFALLAVDMVLRAWARTDTARSYTAELARRIAIDAWAAREVMRRRPRVVIAGSLAARRTFAAARAIGARCVLALDLPLLRALHHDLYRAARAWPTRAFLRRFRAPTWAIARQEAERALADLILVRGAYAHALCIADGVRDDQLARLPDQPAPTVAPPAASSPRTGRIRLAGLAAARHGIDTALMAARALGTTLVVRTGEGTEPADLAHLPGVAVDDGPVDAIICPAICETYAPELRTSGVPVIASPFASADGAGPDPYDADAFAAAIATAATAAPAAPPAVPALAPRLAALGMS
jgi:hypothetical protein